MNSVFWGSFPDREMSTVAEDYGRNESWEERTSWKRRERVTIRSEWLGKQSAKCIQRKRREGEVRTVEEEEEEENYRRELLW